jgi:hypothetical protein
VFIDRALIVVPLDQEEIPEESQCSQLLASINAFAGMASATFLAGSAGSDAIGKVDFPTPPVITTTVDPKLIEEIRRTIYVTNIDDEISSGQILAFFSGVGEIKYMRFCKAAEEGTRYAFVEFSKVESVPAAMQYNGVLFGGRPLKVAYAKTWIKKPESEIIASSKKRSRSRSRHRSPRRSSTTRRKSRSSSRRRKSRSRSRGRKRRSRSRSRKRRSRSRSKKRESRSKRRSRTRSKDRKKSKKSKSRSPSRRKSKKSKSKSPRRKSSVSPSRKKSKSPSRKKSKSPSRKASVSPEKKKSSKSPDKKKSSKSPDKKRSPSRSPSKSPSRKKSKSPSRKKSKTPERKKSKSPRRKRSKTPDRKRSKSPKRRRSKSPDRKKSRKSKSKSPEPKKKSKKDKDKDKKHKSKDKDRDSDNKEKKKDKKEKKMNADTSAGDGKLFAESDDWDAAPAPAKPVGFKDFAAPTVTTPGKNTHTAQYLKKVLSKSNTPKKKLSQIEKLKTKASSSESKAKRVNWALTKNMSTSERDLLLSIKSSPGIPHDPRKKPDKGLLKTKTAPRTPQNENPVQLNTQLNSISKKGVKMAMKFERMAAKDFFF